MNSSVLDTGRLTEGSPRSNNGGGANANSGARRLHKSLLFKNSMAGPSWLRRGRHDRAPSSLSRYRHYSLSCPKSTRSSRCTMTERPRYPSLSSICSEWHPANRPASESEYSARPRPSSSPGPHPPDPARPAGRLWARSRQPGDAGPARRTVRGGAIGSPDASSFQGRFGPGVPGRARTRALRILRSSGGRAGRIPRGTGRSWASSAWPEFC